MFEHIKDVTQCLSVAITRSGRPLQENIELRFAVLAILQLTSRGSYFYSINVIDLYC